MDTKFTPGPWRIGTPGPNGCMTIGAQNGLMTAVIAHSINENDQRETAQANALLVAACPEVLGALMNLVRELEQGDDEGLLSHSETMIAARRAIAKATGTA